ncbi:MAG: MFS transporter [Rhizobiaceae bacterium]|nr:MFS transporter [Rhizobiaceae bacterium]
MRLVISLSALLLSIIFVQVGSGSLGPLDALSGLELGFSSTAIGYLGSAHFVGFFVGCVVSPYVVVRSGHARAFAVMAAISTISIILHPVVQEVWFWIILRLMSGFSVAGSYTVIESWLQSKLNKNNRGTVFSVYRMVDMTGTLLSQLVIAGLSPAHYVSYNLIAVVAALALVPLALTQNTVPSLPQTGKFQPLFVFKLSPLAAIGVVVVGLTNSSFRMVAPVYAAQSGLEKAQIAIFLALAIVGGLVAQMPAGIIADKLSRRISLIGFSVLSAAVCLLVSSGNIGELFGVPFVYIGSFLFGFATLPIYSICASHASDFAKPEEMLAMSASLIFFYALGAVISPSLAGYLIDVYGPPSMFQFIMAAHVFLLVFTFWRSLRRPVANVLRPYRYMPRTTLYIAHLTRRKKSDASKAFREKRTR